MRSRRRTTSALRSTPAMALAALVAVLPGGSPAVAAPAAPAPAVAAGRAQVANPYGLPDELLVFWNKYGPAQAADDETAMDRAVRLHPDLALRTLDLLLDELRLNDTAGMRDELRALGRSIDRTERTTRYLERVRFVLDLAVPARRARTEAMDRLGDAYELLREARTQRSEEAWAKAYAAFEKPLPSFEQIGDLEMQVLVLQELAEIEKSREREWERAVLLVRARDLARELPYPDPIVDAATSELAAMLLRGIDPSKEKPTAPAAGGGKAAEESGGAATGGRGLTSFAPGSVEERVALEMEAGKKGLAGVVLPGFRPYEQLLLWPWTWIDGNGPTAFDANAYQRFQLFGGGVSLVRDESEYGFDVNADGQADVRFTPSSNPQRVDLPSPDGKRFYPLMVCVPGDREAMFSLELNYSPQPRGAQVRFQAAGGMSGKVLGETWTVYDANVNGVFGDFVEMVDDTLTAQPAVGREAFDDFVLFCEMDGVLIGKAKKALPWSSVLPVGKGFVRATIAPDGSEIAVQPLSLQTGAVQLDMDSAVQPTYLIVQEVGGLEGAFFDVVPARKGGAVTLPAGTYRIVSGRLQSGSKTSLKLSRIYAGRSQPFEVKTGETHVLALGAPYALEVETRLEDRELVVDGTSIRIYGRGGEEHAQLFDDALQPDVELRSPDGRKVGKPQRMAKADVESWQTGPRETVWFPLPLRIEARDPGLRVRLSQKSHPLLGGPLAGPEAP